MDYYQIIANNFQATIESLAMSVDELAEPLASAGELLSGALLQDHKILACGNGVDAALAQLFTCNLLHRFERERPALPALSLAVDGACGTAISGNSGIDELFSRQIRALGQPGDVLLCINSAEGAANNLQRAIGAAGERGMSVISLGVRSVQELKLPPGEAAVSITTNGTAGPRAVEALTLIINCLCELLDQNLFGPLHRET